MLAAVTTRVRHGLLLVVPFLVAGSAAAQDMPLSQVLIDGEDWELVAEGFQFTEGPAVDGKGNLYFTDVPANRIHKLDADGKLSTFLEDSQATNGLMFGPDGKLYGCQNGLKRIVAFDRQGRATVVTDNVNCNDLVVTADGGVYFTDPPGNRVWYVSPEGKRRSVAEGFRPNGVILWPNQGTLVATDSNAPHLWTFRVEEAGELAHRERYYHPLRLTPGRSQPGSDGMTVDTAGRLYVATHAGLQVFDPTGRKSGVILKPQRKFLSNVVFGGPNLQWLYVTCSDKVYRRKTKTTGVLYFKKTEVK